MTALIVVGLIGVVLLALTFVAGGRLDAARGHPEGQGPLTLENLGAGLAGFGLVGALVLDASGSVLMGLGVGLLAALVVLLAVPWLVRLIGR